MQKKRLFYCPGHGNEQLREALNGERIRHSSDVVTHGPIHALSHGASPAGARLDLKAPVEVNSTVAKVFALGENACTRSRAPRCAGTPQSGYFTVQDMGMNSSEKRSMAKGSVIPAM